MQITKFNFKVCVLQALAPLCIQLFSTINVANAQSLQNPQSQNFPAHAITFVVPFTSGTTADVLSRLIGQKLSEKLNVPVIVDNKAGASGIIGSDAVAKAQPNGYTLLSTATSFTTLAAINAKLPYDPLLSFSPVIYVGKSAMGLAVSPTLQVNTLKEFVDATRSNPNKFNYSSPGQGSIQHLAMELFMQDSGLQMLHVPYKGAAGAVTDLIAGIDQASVISLVTASSFIRNGQIKLLAVMGEERNPAFANVPTMKEAGYPNMIVETWYGVLAPASTPADVVKRINSEINEILLLPEVKEAMQKQGAMLVGGDPDRFKDLLKKEVAKWSKLMTNPRIKVN